MPRAYKPPVWTPTLLMLLLNPPAKAGIFTLLPRSSFISSRSLNLLRVDHPGLLWVLAHALLFHALFPCTSCFLVCSVLLHALFACMFYSLACSVLLCALSSCVLCSLAFSILLCALFSCTFCSLVCSIHSCSLFSCVFCSPAYSTTWLLLLWKLHSPQQATHPAVPALAFLLFPFLLPSCVSLAFGAHILHILLHFWFVICVPLKGMTPEGESAS